MKKLILILLIVVYTVATVGINFNFFYCCNKLSGVSFSRNNQFNYCNTTTPTSCCTHKTVSVKLNSEQEKSIVHTLKLTPATVLVFANNWKVLKINFHYLSNTFISVFYPPPNHPSFQVLYCIFRL